MKGNFKKIFLIVGSICSTIAICIVFGFFGRNEEDIIMNRIVGIVAIISGMGSFLVGISSIFTTSLDNVREYFASGEQDEISESRHMLYNYRNIKIKYGKTVYDADFDSWVKENISEDDKNFYIEGGKNDIFRAASKVANFYQMWGLLQSRNFLPIWVFDTTSGYNVIKLYQSMADIIAHKREENLLYAGHFEELCNRIYNKYHKVINLCRDGEKELITKKFGVKDIDNNEIFTLMFWQKKRKNDN